MTLSDTDLAEVSPEIRALAASSKRTRTPVGTDGAVMTWREWGPESGGGEPLVLLHGSHGGWMHWLRNIPELARHRRVIVPDMPGFGESDPPADIESPQDHARAMVDGLRALEGISGPVDVIAFSLGAMLGCFMTLPECGGDAPQLIRRLIIVDAGGLDTPLRTADNRSVKGLTGQALRDVNRHNLGAMMIHDPACIDDTAIDISMFCGRRTRTRVMYHVIPDKLLAVAKRVRVPIDVIWAEFDYIHPDPELNTAVIRAFQPEVQLRVVADSGHWPMYEQPAAFTAAALDLLATPVRPLLPETEHS